MCLRIQEVRTQDSRPSKVVSVDRAPNALLSRRRTTSSSSASASVSASSSSSHLSLQLPSAGTATTTTSTEAISTKSKSSSITALDALRRVETVNAGREPKKERFKKRPASIDHIQERHERHENYSDTIETVEEDRIEQDEMDVSMLHEGKETGKEDDMSNGQAQEGNLEEDERNAAISATAVPEGHYRREGEREAEPLLFLTVPLEVLRSSVSIGTTLVILPFKLAFLPVKVALLPVRLVTHCILDRLASLSAFASVIDKDNDNDKDTDKINKGFTRNVIETGLAMSITAACLGVVGVENIWKSLRDR